MHFNLKITALLLFGFAFLIACNDAAKPVKVEQAKTNTATAPQADEHGHADDAPRITLADAKKDFDDGQAIFIDTRGEGNFKNEHIKGAMNIPVEFAETRYKEIPTDKKIIVYCS